MTKGSPQVRADFGVGEQFAEVEVLLALALDHPGHVDRLDPDQHDWVANTHRDRQQSLVGLDRRTVAVLFTPGEHRLHAACVDVFRAHLGEG